MAAPGDRPQAEHFLECFNPERPVRLHSIVLGLAIGAVLVTMMGKNAPPVVEIVVPASWILVVEYASRFLEWLVKKGIPLF